MVIIHRRLQLLISLVATFAYAGSSTSLHSIVGLVAPAVLAAPSSESVAARMPACHSTGRLLIARSIGRLLPPHRRPSSPHPSPLRRSNHRRGQLDLKSRSWLGMSPLQEPATPNPSPTCLLLVGEGVAWLPVREGACEMQVGAWELSGGRG